jgi:hypothetical protein
MNNNSIKEPLPVPPGYGKPKELPPFEKSDIAGANAIEEELEITIPRRLYESVPMYRIGYYFSSDDRFLGTHTDSAFIEPVKNKINAPLVAFG